MKTESTSRQDQIVEAATRRFSHFGIAKSTFTEVAEDLGLTKQALSYHFHDKQSLVMAVIDRITEEYAGVLEMEMKAAASVEEGLLKLTEVKSRFFEKYYLLIIQADQLELNTKLSWRQILTEREERLISEQIARGMDSGEIAEGNVKETSRLLLQTLHAFSRCLRDKNLPSRADFINVLKQQKEVIRLFYKGLKWQA